MVPTIYVTLPPDMVAVRYPGYFYHITEHVLYSIKGGMLKPVKWRKPNRFTYYQEPFVHVSHKGKRRTMSKTYLERLGIKGDKTVVPFKTT